MRMFLYPHEAVVQGKNISTDLLFMDAAKGDFRLSSGSSILTASKKGPLGAPEEVAKGDGINNGAFNAQTRETEK